jgi:hypothetical protein
MRVRMNGQLQYAGNNEAVAARNWFTAWAQRNDAKIDRTRGRNAFESSNITPDPDPEVGSCTRQLTFDFYFTLPDNADYNAMMAEIQAAVYDGGVAQARCYSSLDFSQETD